MQSRVMEKMYKNLEKEFYFLDVQVKPEIFIKQKFKISLTAGIIFFLLWSLLADPFPYGALASVLAAFAIFIYLLQEPKRKSELEAKQIEAKLPFGLNALAIELNTGRDFDSSLEEIADSDYGILSQKLKSSLQSSLQSGKSVQSALLGLASKTKSKHFVRTIAMIISVYENRSGKNCAEPLKKISSELFARQKSEMKEFSGKLSVFSLLFIVVAAILPALFQSFVTIGSGFMEMPLGSLELLMVSTAVFPLLDAAILGWIYCITPQSMK